MNHERLKYISDTNGYTIVRPLGGSKLSHYTDPLFACKYTNFFLFRLVCRALMTTFASASVQKLTV